MARSKSPLQGRRVPSSAYGGRGSAYGRGEPTGEQKAQFNKERIAAREADVARAERAAARQAKLEAMSPDRREKVLFRIGKSALRKAAGSVTRGVLSPAVLAEEVAARVARDVEQKREERMARKRVTKLPKTRA